MRNGSVTRRELLAAGVGVTGSALFFGAFGLGIFKPLDDARHLREATYRPLVGNTFKVVREGGTVDLELTGVRSLGPLRYRDQLIAGKEHFALEFEGHGPDRLPSSLQTFAHPDLGRFQLFVSPVGLSSSTPRYEAIVNTFDMTTWRKLYG
jgi:hypothetical protein